MKGHISNTADLEYPEIMDIKNVAFIMAGGKGERLWPLSTEERPKQLIPLLNGKSLLDLAVERVGDLAEVIILTNKKIADKIKGNFKTFVESIPKNTAPALIYATYKVHKEYGNTLIAALPSDHYIGDIENFRQTLKNAYEYAYKTKHIITFGIKPTYPHTGYGYIERGERFEGNIYKVKKFHEKPDKEKAEEYIKSGNFYWNSGMFVWESEAFLEIVKDVAPEIYGILDLNEGEFFERSPEISIDYAVMEKTNRIMVIEANFKWLDVGSYRSLYEILPKDERENAYRNIKPFVINSSKNLSIAEKEVVLIGVEGVAVVETENIIMVLKLEKDQDVREAARRFKK